jgi:hypothetical protein
MGTEKVSETYVLRDCGGNLGASTINWDKNGGHRGTKAGRVRINDLSDYDIFTAYCGNEQGKEN